MNRELAMFPLGMVVFPHQTVGLCVFEPRYHRLLADVESEHRFGTCLIERGSDVGGGDERWLVDDPYPRAVVGQRCCDDVPIEAALLKSTESAVRALRALQSEVFADECLQRNCAMDDDPGVRSWQLCALTPMALLDQFKVISLSNPNDRLRLLAEICC